MFDWNDVQVFLAIARGGSLAAAARTLKVNHSTVFRRLNTFEDALGVRNVGGGERAEIARR